MDPQIPIQTHLPGPFGPGRCAMSERIRPPDSGSVSRQGSPLETPWEWPAAWSPVPWYR
jgi:hypothetical protein